MALAFTRWGLGPDAFWRLTPREIGAVLQAGHPAPALPLSPADLARLAARYPDGEAHVRTPSP